MAHDVQDDSYRLSALRTLEVALDRVGRHLIDAVMDDVESPDFARAVGAGVGLIVVGGALKGMTEQLRRGADASRRLTQAARRLSS